MKNFLIGEALVNAIAAYLVTRPYREVANLISAMSEMQQLPEHAPSEKDGSREG